MHTWLRVSIPLSRPLDSRGPILPILYKPQRAGSDRCTVIGSDLDSVKDDAVAGELKFAYPWAYALVILTLVKAVMDVTTHANVLW